VNVVIFSVAGRRVRRRAVLAGAVTLAAGLGGCTQQAPKRPSAVGSRDVDVAVIGAGIAGLAAAAVVSAAGRSCVVLEARNRLGGRIWTSNAWADLPVDLGASWIHGTDGNPVFEETTRLGIPTTVFDVGSFEGSGSAVYHSGTGATLNGDEIEAHTDAVISYLQSTAGTADAGRRSFGAGIDDLPERLREIAADPVIAAALTDYAGDYAATPEELALRALNEDDSFPGPQRVFPAGYGQLVQRLAEGLPVRLSTPVASVSLKAADHVVVDTADGQWRAARVIVTVPLGVLKSGGLRFDPPLPASHRRAIGAIGVGRFEKLVLRFDTAFWDDVDEIRVAGYPGKPFTGWYNLHRVIGRPALMSLNGGVAASAIDGVPVDRQTQLAGEVLKGVYPGRFRPPVAAQASHWWADEFSRGSYSFTAVGSGPADRKGLAVPVAGRLWLAGEATHPALHSTVHGAWLSGRAAAEQATT
jgi:monoamine oxidase